MSSVPLSISSVVGAVAVALAVPEEDIVAERLKIGKFFFAKQEGKLLQKNRKFGKIWNGKMENTKEIEAIT